MLDINLKFIQQINANYNPTIKLYLLLSNIYTKKSRYKLRGKIKTYGIIFTPFKPQDFYSNSTKNPY